jgi:transposase-like protein
MLVDNQRTLPRLVDNLNPTRRYVIAFGYKLQPRQCKELNSRLSEFHQPIWQQHYVIFKTAQENTKTLIRQIFDVGCL